MSGKIGLRDFGVCWRIEQGFADSRSRRERRDQRNILILPSDLSRQIIAFFCPRALFLLCSTFQKDWECFLESISTLLVLLSTQTEETPVTRERLIGMSFIEVFQHLYRPLFGYIGHDKSPRSSSTWQLSDKKESPEPTALIVYRTIANRACLCC